MVPRQAQDELLGSSPPMVALRQLIHRIAPLESTVLIQGETGTGKERVARLLHAQSPRARGPFVAVHCASFAETLVEAELFGHEKGAFTGATARRVGRLESAQGGTLFIDEVGDMPAPVQVKLLRVLQERELERIGGHVPVALDVRIVAATHHDLRASARAGTFREDLYFRLNVVPLLVPALRDRGNDVLELAQRFLDLAQAGSRLSGIRFSDEARGALQAHRWPGNVRELQNSIERAVAHLAGSGPGQPGQVTAALLGLAPSSPTPVTLRERLDIVEREIVLETLGRHGGNRTRAAAELGLTRQALAKKLARWPPRAPGRPSPP